MIDPTPEDVERVGHAICSARDSSNWCGCRSNGGCCRDMAARALAAMPDHSALIRELRDALNEAKRRIAEDFAVIEDSYRVLFPGDPDYGGFDAEGEAERAPYVAVLAKVDAALRKVNEALGEKA